jgi:hypothetical protein
MSARFCAGGMMDSSHFGGDAGWCPAPAAAVPYSGGGRFRSRSK